MSDGGGGGRKEERKEREENRERKREREYMCFINMIMSSSILFPVFFRHCPDIQKTLYSSTVCTMIYSTAEAVPLSVYGEAGVCLCVSVCVYVCVTV